MGTEVDFDTFPGLEESGRDNSISASVMVYCMTVYTHVEEIQTSTVDVDNHVGRPRFGLRSVIGKWDIGRMGVLLDHEGFHGG